MEAGCTLSLNCTVIGCPISTQAVRPPKMSQSLRVKNLTRGLHWKFNRAEKAVCNCACAWVEFGVSVRDLTIAESIKMRNEQAAIREPLAYAEIPGLVYSGATDYSLVRAAHQFVQEAEWPSRSHVDQVIAQMEALS